MTHSPSPGPGAPSGAPHSITPLSLDPGPASSWDATTTTFAVLFSAAALAAAIAIGSL